MPASVPQDVQSAGVVVLRPGRRVLLVHRPKYDDWSFPKGKLERGEHVVAAAVREVAEETGVHARLGVPLSRQRYPIVGDRMKQVHYWVGRAVGDHDVSDYRPNAEIDGVAWVDVDDAHQQLTYDYDRATLTEALAVRRKTRAVVVMRHGKARSRSAWRGDDRERSLLQLGQHQAERLVPLLAAYDVTSVISSSSLRCVQTVTPFADVADVPVQTDAGLSEEDATPRRVLRVVQQALDEPGETRGVAICSHRPVLPLVFDALGLDDPELAPGEMLVAHVRKGAVRGVERHLPG